MFLIKLGGESVILNPIIKLEVVENFLISKYLITFPVCTVRLKISFFDNGEVTRKVALGYAAPSLAFVILSIFVKTTKKHKEIQESSIVIITSL